MALLATLHRWTGGLVGLILALIGLSGTVLVWEEAWIALPGADEPYRSTTADLGAVMDGATVPGRDLSRVTFADDNFGLHLAIYDDGGGAYLDQAGRVVDSWDSAWGRPELWLFDFHHYLFAGETGEYVTGVLGSLLLAFTLTGVILWWRTRRTFDFRLWPKRMSRSAIVRQHRDLGMIASPLLLISALTGTLMIFPPLSDALLAPFASASPLEKREYEVKPAGDPDYGALLAAGQAAFPDARPRRIQMPADPTRPLVLRLKQSFEWTPNGRTYAYLDPGSGRVIGIDDPATGDRRAAIQEKFYPVHAGKVGGWPWKLLLTFGGLTLVLLGTLASWSFWFRRSEGRVQHRARAIAPQPAR